MRKEFGGLVAVNDVSFDGAAPARSSALIGPNGAGKSTMFNLITGVLAADRGEVALPRRRIDRRTLVARDRAAAACRAPSSTCRLLPADDGARERRARRAPARPGARGVLGGACCGSTAREEASLLRRGGAPARARRPGRPHVRAGRQPARSASSACWRSRARWPPTRPAAARRAGRRPALPGEAGAGRRAAQAARRGPVASCWSSTTWTS